MKNAKTRITISKLAVTFRFMRVTLIKNTFVLLLILTCGRSLSAQNYTYAHYGVEDGLPSSEVYYVFQDSKGYMWFATDAGVSRFNGYEFENFDASDGLTDNTIFQITEDPEGRIWFGTFNLRLCYYLDGKIHPYQHNDILSDHFQNKSALISFKVDSNQTIWMGLKHKGLLKIKDGELTKISDEDSLTLNIIWDSNDLIYGGVTRLKHLNKKELNSLLTYTYQYEVEVLDKNTKENVMYELSHTSSGSKKVPNLGFQLIENLIFCSFSPDQSFLLGSPSIGQFYKLKGLSFIKKRIHSTLYDSGHLWICAEGQGVYECEIKKDSIRVLKHYLKGKNVSRVFRDNEKGLWFSTLEEGIYYLTSDNFFVDYLKNKNITKLTNDSSESDIYLSLKSGEIYQINKERRNKKIYKTQSGDYLLKYNYNRSELLITDEFDRTLNAYRGGRIKDFVNLNIRINGSLKESIVDSDTLYLVNNNGLSIVVNEELIYASYPDNAAVWCTSLIKNDKKIWLGTNEGVRVYQDKKVTNPFRNNKYLSSGITSMEKLNKSIYLIGTKSYGLLLMKEDSIIDVINKEKGLIGDLVKTIHVDNHGVIWVGANNGLSRINYTDKDRFDVYNLTTKHGLISGEINDIDSYRDTIYLATTKGLVEFDRMTVEDNSFPPPIYITSFSINEQERGINSSIELTHKENNINIAYEGLSYRSLGEVTYQYRMLGVDTNWITTTATNIRYPTLPHNNYIFEVKAKNEDGYWSQPKNLPFKIKPPIWLTWWFITGGISLGLLVVYLIFRYQIKQIREREKASKKIVEAEKKMVELELKALRSQMNPHFIFNTLNSIQYYIGENDFLETNRYITKFSKLIRMVLNVSEKALITIEEEVEILGLYLDLEKMRFDERFEYTITINKEIDPYYDKIPSMLIQPYIENAIWHGLMNKKEKGKIEIEMEIKGDYLQCTIIDNGIGREAAAIIKKSRKINHKSIGMTITKERLDLINDQKESGVNVEIIDLYQNKNGKSTVKGTKVIVRIPL